MIMRFADPRGMKGMLDGALAMDWSSDDRLKQQQMEALNRMYADGEITDSQYQEMMNTSFSAAEKSDPVLNRALIMLGIRYAGEKLRELDDNYAHAIANALNSTPGTALMADSNLYLSGMAEAPFGGLSDIRKSINDDLPTAEHRREMLRDAFVAELGAAGRYALPASGIAAAGVGINSMLNNGEQHVAPDLNA